MAVGKCPRGPPPRASGRRAHGCDPRPARVRGGRHSGAAAQGRGVRRSARSRVAALGLFIGLAFAAPARADSFITAPWRDPSELERLHLQELLQAELAELAAA